MRLSFPLLLLWLMTAPAVAGGAETLVYDTRGSLFELRLGTYDALFPQGGGGIDPAATVLALDITTEEALDRHLVPGTEGLEVEAHPGLIYDSSSERLFLLWTSSLDQEQFRLRLSSFTQGIWSEPIDATADPVPLIGAPRWAHTGDTYGPPAVEQSRSVVHLLWTEETAGGEAVRYAPIFLLDGVFPDWSPILDLTALDPNPDSPTPSVASPELMRAANIEPGRAGESIIVSAPMARSGRLLTFEVHVLPYRLLSVADDARQHIPGFGRRLQDRSTLRLAEETRTYIASLEGSLHDGVRQYLAKTGYDTILSFGATFEEGELDLVAQSVWDEILDSGASLVGQELQPTADRGCQLMHLRADPQDPTSPSLHQLEICLISDLPLPDAGPGPVTLFASEDGRKVLVLWLEPGDDLRYQQGEIDTWDAARRAYRDGSLSVEEMLTALRRLVRSP